MTGVGAVEAADGVDCGVLKGPLPRAEEGLSTGAM